MQVVVHKLICDYAVIGSGKKTMLCLHGWAADKTSFYALANQLSEDWTIIVPDLPGFGKSEAPSEPWQLADFADFIADFIAKLHVKIDAVVGHSNGGAIAIYGLSQKSFTTRRLVLIASSGVRGDQNIRKQALKLLAKPAKFAIKAAPASTQRRIKQRLYSAIGSDFMVAEHMQETFKNVVSSDVVENARQLSVSTLLIYGDQDTSTPIAHAKTLHHAIKHSQLKIIEGATHFVHQEQPAEVAGLIKK